jgi:RNA polymerase-binding transcription factor DksA
MDIIDEAQGRNEHFLQLAMQNRQFDLAPCPPAKTADDGHPLCVGCDADISQRRQVLPNTQRCTDCQTDFEKRITR